MTYKPTQKELDEAMSDMECYQAQEHLKKCSKCRDDYLESVIKIKLNKNRGLVNFASNVNPDGDESEKMINAYDYGRKRGFEEVLSIIRHNAGLKERK